IDVHVVHTGARTADHLEAVGPFDQVAGERGGGTDQDPVELGDPILELVAVETVAQQLDAGIGDLLLDEDLRLVVHRFTSSAFSSTQSMQAVSASTSAGST